MARGWWPTRKTLDAARRQPALYTETPPAGVPDFGVTSTTHLAVAWFGRGDYAADHKLRQNYRAVATVQQTNYMITAFTKKSGITSLAQIKNRTQPTLLADIVMDRRQKSLPRPC